MVFAVTDHGAGIAPEQQEKVFDLFETDLQGSQHRGTGLGLSLVRSFVELHGGSVTIESATDEGTTVTCMFPITHAARQTPAVNSSKSRREPIKAVMPRFHGA